MTKISGIVAMALVMAFPAGAREYTLAQLASIAGTGVTVVDGEYVLTKNTALTADETLDDGGITVNATSLTINEGNSLRLVNGDELHFDDNALLVVNGDINADVTTGAKLTTTIAGTTTARGIRVYSDNSVCRFTNVTFERVGITFGATAGSLTVDKCIFVAHNGALSNNAINFVATSSGNAVTETEFTACYGGCIATGAINPVGISISGCKFNSNGTSGRLLPAINICCGGDNDIVIEDNEVIGIGEVTRTGGIALSNLMSMPFTNTCYVRRNEVRDNSYGITMTGGGNVVIEDNIVCHNNLIANPMSGGSGINITNTAGTTTARITGNRIEDNYWGITIIGANNVNCGKTGDTAASDYNRGENHFKNNGNGTGIYAKCDLANNGAATVYAQGNYWSATEVSADAIEQCVYHKADNASLGEVIYMPAGNASGISDLNADSLDDNAYYDLQGRRVSSPTAGIYIHRGAKVLMR